MRFKLDENFGISIQRLIVEQGHDCITVRDENLTGAPDPDVLKAAVGEDRVLMTMDLDFGNVSVYPPEKTGGIHPPGRVSLPLLQMLVRQVLIVLGKRTIRGRLWIVEPGRIREHESGTISGWEENVQVSPRP